MRFSLRVALAMSFVGCIGAPLAAQSVPAWPATWQGAATVTMPSPEAGVPSPFACEIADLRLQVVAGARHSCARWGDHLSAIAFLLEHSRQYKVGSRGPSRRPSLGIELALHPIPLSRAALARE